MEGLATEATPVSLLWTLILHQIALGIDVAPAR